MACLCYEGATYLHRCLKIEAADDNRTVIFKKIFREISPATYIPFASASPIYVPPIQSVLLCAHIIYI